MWRAGMCCIVFSNMNTKARAYLRRVFIIAFFPPTTASLDAAENCSSVSNRDNVTRPCTRCTIYYFHLDVEIEMSPFVDEILAQSSFINSVEYFHDFISLPILRLPKRRIRRIKMMNDEWWVRQPSVYYGCYILLVVRHLLVDLKMIVCVFPLNFKTVR